MFVNKTAIDPQINSSYPLLDQVKTLQEKTQTLALKAFSKIQEFFNYLKNLFSSSSLVNRVQLKLTETAPQIANLAKELFFPYEEIPSTQGSENFFIEVLQEAFTNPTENITFETPEVLSKVVDTLSKVSQSVIIPWTLLSATQGGLTSSVVTASCLNGLVFSTLYPFMSPSYENEQTKWLVNDLDRYFYQTGLVSAGTLLGRLTPGLLQKPLNFAVVALSCSPKVQNRVLNLPYIQEAHQFTKNSALQLRVKVKQPLKAVIKWGLQKAGPQLLNNFRTPPPPATNFRVIFLHKETRSERAMNIIAGYAGHLIREQLVSMTSSRIDRLADSLAEKAIDFSIGTVKQAVELRFLYQGLTASYRMNPLLGAASVVIQGGPQQSVRELAFRVVGAVTLLSTGSGLLAMAVVYSPKLLNFAMYCKNKRVKRNSIAHTPALKVFQNHLYTPARTFAEAAFKAPKKKSWIERLDDLTEVNIFPNR